MNEIRRCIASAMLVGLVICAALAQQPNAGVMGAAEVTKVVPKEYFFRGQSAADNCAIRLVFRSRTARWCWPEW